MFEIKDLEDRGFYSDIFKDENGVRPRWMSNKELSQWMEDNFTVVNKQIIKKRNS